LRDVRNALRDLERHPLAGLILVTPLLKVRLEDVQALCRNLPFVMIDIRKGAELPSVLFDQAHGSAWATRHLLALGHREICEISGPLTWSGAFGRHHAWGQGSAGFIVDFTEPPGRSLEQRLLQPERAVRSSTAPVKAA